MEELLAQMMGRVIGATIFPIVAFWILEIGFGTLPILGTPLANATKWLRKKYTGILFAIPTFFLKWTWKGAKAAMRALWRAAKARIAARRSSPPSP